LAFLSLERIAIIRDQPSCESAPQNKELERDMPQTPTQPHRIPLKQFARLTGRLNRFLVRDYFHVERQTDVRR
jgi:hypothetical protein